MLITVLMLLLTACPRPLVPPTGLGGAQHLQADAESGVTGHVDFGRRATQATIKDDVAPGATVSLIEVATGNTVTTTRTDADGKFVLKYTNGFKPLNNAIYYFEAVKGLSGGTGQPNAVGADAVRVRTIASYRRGGWVTLSSRSVSSLISITPMTTALSIVVSLRSTTNRPLDVNTLFGTIRLGVGSDGFNDAVDLPDPALVAMVQSTYNLVLDSFNKDRDPLRWVLLNAADASHNSVILPDVPFSIVSLSPAEQEAGGEIQLIGSNFASVVADNEVAFQTNNNAIVSAAVLAVSSDLARLTVKVPLTAVNGPVTLTIGKGDKRKTLLGPNFRVATRDGHSVVDASGNVYVANRDLGTVAVIGPNATTGKTEIRALIANLDKPGALTFAPGDYSTLYVALGGATRKVMKYTLSPPPITGVDYSAAGGVANPSGIAFRVATGALYLTDAAANKLYVVAAAGGPAIAVDLVGAPLDQPRGLSFGPDGKLYVANSGSGNVLAIDLTSAAAGSASIYQSGLSSPWGLAFDNKGSFYVSNNKGNSIFTVPVTSEPGALPLIYGALTSFASIPNPGGLDADSSGYLYVADNVSNGVYRVNPAAESRQIGFGISYPVATWADAEGVFTLTQDGRLLQIDTQNALSVYAEGLTAAAGLVRDKRGNFYTYNTALKALILVRPDGSSMLIMPALDAYYPEMSISNARDRLYFRRRNSDISAMGQVDAYDLNLDAGPPYMPHFNVGPDLAAAPNQVYKSPMRRVVAIAADRTAAGPHRGKYYVLHDSTNSEQAILRVTRVDDNTYDAVRIVNNAGNTLKDPSDIAIDSEGKIWVADRLGTSGAGGLIIYDANGAYLDEIAVARPVRLAYNGTHVVVSCYDSGEVRFYNANKTLAQTLSGIPAPVGVAFSSTAPHVNAMFVNSHSTGKVYKFDNYAALGNASVAASLAANAYYDTGNNNDIEMVGNALIFTSGTQARRLESDRRTRNDSWMTQYSSYLRFSVDHNGSRIFVTDYSWSHLAHNGAHSAAFSGLRALSPTGIGAAVVLGNSMVSHSHSGYGHNAFVVDSEGDGISQRSRNGLGYLGAATGNGTDSAFFATTTGGTIYKWKKDAVTGKGVASTLVSGGYSGADFIRGLSYYDGYVYQPIREKHVIRKINAENGADRAELKVGVVAPEL
ncbi:Serine/threonine-protein kinase PknD [compost metagenome]